MWKVLGIELMIRHGFHRPSKRHLEEVWTHLMETEQTKADIREQNQERQDRWQAVLAARAAAASAEGGESESPKEAGSAEVPIEIDDSTD